MHVPRQVWPNGFFPMALQIIFRFNFGYIINFYCELKVSLVSVGVLHMKPIYMKPVHMKPIHTPPLPYG
jgi:hypothetical protein